jgi:hypothetical protein
MRCLDRHRYDIDHPFISKSDVLMLDGVIKKAPSKLGHKGWTRVGKNGWKCSKSKLVIKQPFLFTYIFPDAVYRKDAMVPTVFLDDGWVIQPLCKLQNKKSALHAVRSILGDNKDFYDLHTGNVGWLHDSPYLFDW